VENHPDRLAPEKSRLKLSWKVAGTKGDVAGSSISSAIVMMVGDGPGVGSSRPIGRHTSVFNDHFDRRIIRNLAREGNLVFLLQTGYIHPESIRSLSSSIAPRGRLGQA
jgi:hypothetical protein